MWFEAIRNVCLICATGSCASSRAAINLQEDPASIRTSQPQLRGKMKLHPPALVLLAFKVHRRGQGGFSCMLEQSKLMLSACSL